MQDGQLLKIIKLNIQKDSKQWHQHKSGKNYFSLSEVIVDFKISDSLNYPRTENEI